MKYMGSKRAMLTNGLGVLINEAVIGRSRFVDLFTGSGAVAKFVAANQDVPVLATDLQRYAVVLTGAVIQRTKPVFTVVAWDSWSQRATAYLNAEVGLRQFADAIDVTNFEANEHQRYVDVLDTTRDACSFVSDRFPLCRAYGGYYFGMSQSLWLDALRATVPEGELRQVALASLVEAASTCSASPGHTAQPFASSETGLPHLLAAWSKDLPDRVRQYFLQIGSQHAKKKGSACVADAVKQTGKLRERDLVFLDPPYSEVQYSRFYHVLESIASGNVGDVTGIGRYPSIENRPQSKFSCKSPAPEEFDRLMIGVAASGAHALITFPEAEASNGLSGELVEAIAGQYFRVARRVVKSTFSTLGGTGVTRNARQGTTELILHLLPR